MHAMNEGPYYCRLSFPADRVAKLQDAHCSPYPERPYSGSQSPSNQALACFKLAAASFLS
jgi:hypothetical protein